MQTNGREIGSKLEGMLTFKGHSNVAKNSHKTSEAIIYDSSHLCKKNEVFFHLPPTMYI